MKSAMKKSVLFIYLVAVTLAFSGCGGGGSDDGAAASGGSSSGTTHLVAPSWDVNGFWALSETAGTNSCGNMAANDFKSLIFFINDYSANSNELEITAQKSTSTATYKGTYTGTISGTHIYYTGQEIIAECPLGYFFTMDLYLQGYPIYDTATGTKQWTCYYPGGACSGTKDISATFIRSSSVITATGPLTNVESTFPLPSTSTGAVTILGRTNDSDNTISSLSSVNSFSSETLQSSVPVHRYFKFTVEKDTKIFIDLEFDSNIDLDLYLFSENSGQPSTLLAEANHSLNPEWLLMDLTPGTYYIGVRALNTYGKDGYYTLNILDFNLYVSKNEWEPNDSPSTTAWGYISVNTSKKGYINPAADFKRAVDWSDKYTYAASRYLYDFYPLKYLATRSSIRLDFTVPNTVTVMQPDPVTHTFKNFQYDLVLYVVDMATSKIVNFIFPGLQTALDPGSYAIGIGSESTLNANIPYTLKLTMVNPQPTKVTGVTFTQTANSLIINWNPSTDDTGVVGYNVYRREGLNWVLKKTVTETTYTDTDVVLGKAYDYNILAFDAQGTESDWSIVSFSFLPI